MISLLYACATLVLLIWSGDGRRKTAVYLIRLLSPSALIAVAGFSTEKMSYSGIGKPLLSKLESFIFSAGER